jgi:hypothetical protein
MTVKPAIEGLMQSAGLHVLEVHLPGSNRSLLLFYGPRIFQQHTVTTLNSLAAQYGQQLPPWLQQLLQLERDNAAGQLAFVRQGEQQQPQQEGSSYELVCADRQQLDSAEAASSPDTPAEVSGDSAAGLRQLLAGLAQAISTAAGAVTEARALQQQKQQQAYRRVLEQIYASAAAPPSVVDQSNNSAVETDSSSNSSSQSIADLLLPQLTVSPLEGQADSFDYISEAWADWSDGNILDIDMILGPGAKPTGIQRWLLPQLLDDAQPPLLVVAPPGTGRVTAVLLAAAAELAASAAGEQQGAEGAAEQQQGMEEEGETGGASVAGSDSDAEVEGGDVEGEGAEGEMTDVVLPWEVEDEADATDLVDDGQQQQQQGSRHQAAVTEGADVPTAVAAAAGDEDATNDRPGACSPFMLLMLPTQAAAAAAAAQHGPVMAAAGVRLALLPPLDQQLQQQWEATLAAKGAAERSLLPEIRRLERLQKAQDAHLRSEQHFVQLVVQRANDNIARIRQEHQLPRSNQVPEGVSAVPDLELSSAVGQGGQEGQTDATSAGSAAASMQDEELQLFEEKHELFIKEKQELLRQALVQHEEVSGFCNNTQLNLLAIGNTRAAETLVTR